MLQTAIISPPLEMHEDLALIKRVVWWEKKDIIVKP